MHSMCVYEKECASVYDMQEFADESCTISVNIVSKMYHAVQYIERGKNVASQEAIKHLFFFFKSEDILPHLFVFKLCHW